MSKLFDFQQLVSETGLPERTIRYYLARVLNAPTGTRGRKTFYSQETLAQLKLTKQVLMQEYDPNRGEVKPSLEEFQNWLAGLSTEDIQKMSAMPYSIKPKMLLEVAAPQTFVAQMDPKQSGQEQWQIYRFGEDLQIKTRNRLGSVQIQQLQLAGRLLQSMLTGSGDVGVST